MESRFDIGFAIALVSYQQIGDDPVGVKNAFALNGINSKGDLPKWDRTAQDEKAINEIFDTQGTTP